MSLKRPCFDGRPVGSIEALARALGIPLDTLATVALTADKRYRGPIVVRKAGRKPRETFDALPSLRKVQQRILDRILRRAALPSYLLGGVKGRSYIDNAARHAGSRVLLGEDIDSFYPSVSVGKVQLIFQHVFRFPPLVAATLARLCTRNGVLVQGAVTSTDLANLALYRTEPELAAEAERRGLRYSRFIDDMHTSSNRICSSGEVQQFLSSMRRVLEREGFTPKRKKQFVATAGGSIRVHGLNVNAAPSTPPQVRQRLRNEMFLLERWAAMHAWDAQIERCFVRVSSLVGHLKQTNPGPARRLHDRLKQLAPLREVYLAARSSTAALLGAKCPRQES